MAELTEDSLEAMLIEICKCMDETGDRITLIPKYFIVRPSDLEALGLTVDEVTKMIKEKNMKSEQIKHSLSVGIKSIQSRVFDRDTDEVISFVKIPIKDSGLVRCTHPVKDLEDIDINITWNENSMRDFGKDELNFARAILRKAQEK